MTRDYERRRLRDIYDRNRRRVDAVANARDRNERRGDRDSARRDNSRKGSDGNKGSAPRRYIVSERVTRRAGFGDGGRQGRVSGGRRRDGSRREDRFADKKVTRRTHRDRFDRAERNAEKKNGGGRRRRGDRDAVADTRRGSRRDNATSNNKKDTNNKQQGGRRFTRGSERRDQRNKNNNNNNSKKNTPKPVKNVALTGDDLNAQLEAYKNNEVFNPAARQQQAVQAQRAANALQNLDAQLDAYRN